MLHHSKPGHTHTRSSMGPPARGVLAGIKQDAQKAKETGGTYDPNSVGSAW